MIKKIMQYFFVFAITLVPLLASAQSVGQSVMASGTTPSASRILAKIQGDYNDSLLKSLSSQLLDNPVIGWKTGGLVKTIFMFCFIFAFVEAIVKKDPNAMVRDMSMLAFYTWLVLALIGGPTYTKFDFLTVNAEKYQNNSGSLDMDIFNFVKYQADQLGDQMFEAVGPDALGASMNESNIMIKNMMNARKTCGQTNKFCLKQFANREKVMDPALVRMNEKDPPRTAPKPVDDSSFTLGLLVQKISGVIEVFSDLTFLIFYLISWIVDLIRAILTQFILIAFGIITGVSFFIGKLFIPFALIPKYRGKVWQALKIPLSASLFGFATSLVVFISGACFSAMNNAAVSVIFTKIMNGDSSGELALVIPNVIISMIAGMVLVTVMQLMAITKVPQLCKDILNLSMDSIVGFAEHLGKVMTDAGVALGTGIITSGVTLGAGVGGGVLGKFAGGMKGMANGAAQSMGFKSPFAGAGPAAFKSPTGGGRGGGGSSGNAFGMPSGGDSSVGGVSTSTIANAAAQSDSLIAKDKGISPEESTGQNASGKAKSKDKNIAKNEKDEKKRPGFMESMIKVAAGDETAMASYFNDKTSGITDTIITKAQSATGANKGDSIFEGANRAYKNNRDTTQVALQNFAQKSMGGVTDSGIKSKKEAESSLGRKKITKDQSASIDDSIQNYERTGNISQSAKNELMSLRNTSEIQGEQKEKTDKLLNETSMVSIAKLNSGQHDQSDIENVYKAKNSDFKSEDFDKQYEKMNVDEFNSYQQEQDSKNSSLLNDVSKKGLDSEKGQSASKELRGRMESGMIGKSTYDSTVKKEVDRLKPKFEKTIQSTAKSETRELFDLNDQISKKESKIAKMQESQERLKSSRPHSETPDDPKIAEMQSDLQQTLAQKESTMKSLQEKFDNNARLLNSDKETKENLSELGIKSNDPRLSKQVNVMDIVRKENPELHKIFENRKKNDAFFSKAKEFKTEKKPEFDVGDMSFGRNKDGSINTDEHRNGTTGKYQKTEDAVSQNGIESLEKELSERKQKLSTFNRDEDYSSSEVILFGQISAEIDVLESIINKYKKGDES